MTAPGMAYPSVARRVSILRNRPVEARAACATTSASPTASTEAVSARLTVTRR